MIRITTDEAIEARLKRQRLALTRQAADAIEILLPENCTHRDRPSCPRCAERRTVRAAADVVREAGGIK